MARETAAPAHAHLMMSGPNLPGGQVPGTMHGPVQGSKSSVYSYLHNQSGLNFAPVVHPPHWEQQQHQWPRDAGSPPPAPPVRDASSLKGIKYGPGHEKFPSWPMSAAAEATPMAVRPNPGGGSHRSKSWTDHTNYPKESAIPYTRPFMKRPNPSFSQQQLKTVLERCEKMSPDESRLYLPRVDREGKLLGDNDYMVPSPPERDVISTKPHLTQADLEEYARSLSTSYRDPPLTKVELEEYAMSYQEPKQSPPHLTQADLEEYSRNYDEPMRPQHHQQPSYAQSEGYHSYVSSTDSIMATPFMDRLRRDSEAVRPEPGPQTAWSDEGDRAGRDSVVTTSSGSASSSETLKWHGSMSDVSVTSSSHMHHQSSSRQLIAHSAKVQTPQRHNSESVLFPAGSSGWQTRVQRNNNHNKLRLFPVNTYTVQPDQAKPNTPVSPTSPQLTVAERIGEIERQQSRYSYLDPDKRLRVSDPTLKAIQKKALLSFYERHHSTSRNQVWRSEPLLAQPAQMTLAPAPQSPPPQPPPRPRGSQASRRASSASDYAGNWREKMPSRVEKVIESGNIKDGPRHQHSNSCGSLSTDLLGPLILGPTILLDDWVPERPPKKAHLRTAFPPPGQDRVPSPDIPPPSPPATLEDEVFAFDEPLPPPPPELHSAWTQTHVDKSKPEEAKKLTDASVNQRIYENGISHKRTVSSERISPPTLKQSPSPQNNKSQLSPNNRNMNQTFARTLSMKRPDNESTANCGVPAMKLADTNWSALRYQTQKLMINGKIATSLPVHEPERMNGNMLLPSKARLQRVPTENQNGSSRSPPHLKPIQSNDPRLRASNIRDSFRSQKNRTTRSPPGERTRHSPPSTTQLEGETNGRLEPTPTNPSEAERRGQQGNNCILSTSKASYLAYRRDSHRERSVPSFEGSYKRTMSPSEVVLDTHNHTPTDCVRLPLTAAVTDKLSPSHHPAHQTELKERCIIIPTTVIDEKLSVKTCDDAPRQRVSCDNIKQLIQIEDLNVNSELVSDLQNKNKQFKEQVEETSVESVIVVKGVEIQTQCDMSVLTIECNVDKCIVTPPLETVVDREIVLLVNTVTSDAASQTEKETTPSEPQEAVKQTTLVRQKLQEEIDCEELSLDLASQLSPSDKLQGILVPAADLKRPTDYVAGLFRLDISQRSRSSSKSQSTMADNLPQPVSEASSESTTQPPLSANSAYFTTSESKAKFLTMFSTDMSQSDQLDNIRDNDELQRKKEELMARLDRKLVVLRAEHLELTEESRVNDELGASVAAQVSCLARPHEAAKYLLHVEEVGKITSLLLGLSGRLARAENALTGMPDNHTEKKILESKRDKLREQLEEAKKLKENIDRRSVFVSNILYKYFNTEEYTDYDHFINMKAKLIMDSREIVDKIKLGEEQLVALKETLSSVES